jgi:hypothetical protein
MTSTVLDLINAGFFDDVEAVLIAFFVFFMLKIIQGKTKTAICDDTFDLQKYFYNNIPENFTIFIKIHEVKGFWHFFRYYIKVEILYAFNDTGVTPQQCIDVLEHRKAVMSKLPPCCVRGLVGF